MEDSYLILCSIKSKNKVFRKACTEIILLNNRIEEGKVRYDRAKAVRRLSFRYSNRLKLTALEGVRNLIYEYECNTCEEIEVLQARLLQLTGTVYDFVETDDEDEEDVVMEPAPAPDGLSVQVEAGNDDDEEEDDNDDIPPLWYEPQVPDLSPSSSSSSHRSGSMHLLDSSSRNGITGAAAVRKSEEVHLTSLNSSITTENSCATQ